MKKRQDTRHDTEIQGRYRTGNGLARDVIVTDLSYHGCKFFDRFSNLKQGAYLSVRIGSIGPLEAVVRWQDGGYVGIQFSGSLHPAVLEHMRDKLDRWTPVDRP